MIDIPSHFCVCVCYNTSCCENPGRAASLTEMEVVGCQLLLSRGIGGYFKEVTKWDVHREHLVELVVFLRRGSFGGLFFSWHFNVLFPLRDTQSCLWAWASGMDSFSRRADCLQDWEGPDLDGPCLRGQQVECSACWGRGGEALIADTWEPENGASGGRCLSIRDWHLGAVQKFLEQDIWTDRLTKWVDYSNTVSPGKELVSPGL